MDSRYIAFLLVLSLVLFCFCALSSAAEKEKPPYEKFAYSIPVEANWTSTLTYLDIGDYITMAGSGSVRPTKASPLIGPEGLGDSGAGFNCPKFPAFALVAKIGKYGDCILVGEKNEITPKEPGYLFFAVNTKDEIRDTKGGAGKFDILVEIYRPTCGDDVCERGESGNCADDCDWCGDSECNANETCAICSKDCGFCEADIGQIESAVEQYFGFLKANDFDGLANITSGKFQDYYGEFKRFDREFKKAVDMLGIEKENELLPEFQFTSIEVKIDEMRDNDAVVNASVDSKRYQFKLGKEEGAWKLKDMRDPADDGWFTSDLDLKSLRDNHNDYLSKITEDEGLTPQEITVDATTKMSPVTIIIIIVVVLAALGVVYFVLKKKGKLGIFKKVRFLKALNMPKGKKIKEIKEGKGRKEETKVEQKAKKEQKEQKEQKEHDIPSIIGETRCPKCDAEVFAHERFCVKCGTKLSKKK